MLFRGLDPIQPLAVPRRQDGVPTGDRLTSEAVGLAGVDRPLTWTFVENILVDFDLWVYWDTTDIQLALLAAVEHARAFFGSNYPHGFAYAGRADEVETSQELTPEFLASVVRERMEGDYTPSDWEDGRSAISSAIQLPDNVMAPLFAYGIFRAGQPGFGSIRPFVLRASDAAVRGSLLTRDGMPLLVTDNEGNLIDGTLLTFHADHAADAYRRVAAIEPFKHYRWSRVQVGGLEANTLIARSPNRGGARPLDPPMWDAWVDPCFTDALDVVTDALVHAQPPAPDDLKSQFRLQSAYLLLWTSIERFMALTVQAGDSIATGLHTLAAEPGFREAFALYVHEPRSVTRADDPARRVRLDPARPERALDYYYQVRSNATHRGKAALADFDILQKSSNELLRIFRFVLTVAQLDASWEPHRVPDWSSTKGPSIDRTDSLTAAVLETPGFRWVEAGEHSSDSKPARRWLLAPCGEPAAFQEARPDAPVSPGPHPIAPVGSGICVACDWNAAHR